MISETVYCPACDRHVAPLRDGSGGLICPHCEELVPLQEWPERAIGGPRPLGLFEFEVPLIDAIEAT